MNFLQAHKIIKHFKSNKQLEFLIACSSSIDNLDVFIRAHAASLDYECKYSTLPFNTLQQTIRSKPSDGQQEIFFLMPWDFLPELDWRSGIPSHSKTVDDASKDIIHFTDLLKSRPSAHFIYLNAPTPPIFSNNTNNSLIRSKLAHATNQLQAEIIEHDAFTLSGYLNQGHPICGTRADLVSKTIVSSALKQDHISHKVLVTDLDNVLWHGVIAEDGLENIQYLPEGLGFRHFIYQTFLKSLKDRGILLVAVSRNDEEVAMQAFEQNDMTLQTSDFISIIASYEAKSSQIKVISERLNLSLDAFVFVDDNPVEIEEVSAALPDVKCKLFPNKDDLLPQLLGELATLFSRDKLSNEDLNKTDLYKKSLQSIAPSDLEGSDLSDFLSGLDMTLSIERKSIDNFDRALQLINKTNQFNLNGIRLKEEEVRTILDNGGCLFTATLGDKYGTHGEVLACLINQEKEIVAFAMSCRIFQRYAEYAFLSWILKILNQEALTLNYVATSRNTPMRKFLDEDSFYGTTENKVLLSSERFIGNHQKKFKLFKIQYE